MKFAIAASACALAIATPAFAQETSPPPPPLQVGGPVTGNAFLPAGTQVMVRMVDVVTTAGDRWSEGDTFPMVVSHDIMLGQYVVIPAGSPVTGRITSLSSRGAFGRSGKMDIEIEHVEVQGRRIDLNGTFRQEGEGATLATLGGALVVGVFAGFITGDSATIPSGRELTVTTANALELSVPASSVQAESRQISEADADWRTYHPYTDPTAHPSARVMEAQRMRDAAVAAAGQRAAGQAEIVAAVAAPTVEAGNGTGADGEVAAPE